MPGTESPRRLPEFPLHQANVPLPCDTRPPNPGNSFAKPNTAVKSRPEILPPLTISV